MSKIFKFFNRVVTQCLAVLALLFTGATIYEIMRQISKREKKREKRMAQKSSEQ